MKAVKILWLVMATLIVADFVFAQTWTQVSAPNTNWNFIACSADGTKLAGTPYPPLNSINSTASGLIYISTNSGTSWTTCNVGNPAHGTWFWSGLQMSADGSILVADSNNVAVYVSTNSGTSWNPTLTPKFNGETIGLIVSSADGTKLVASGSYSPSSFVFTSTNSGQTWTTNISPSSSGFTSMACSADGHTVIANYQFSFYLSTNYGTSWTNISSRVDLTEVRSAGCVSADGSILTVKGDGGLVISTNSGTTWSLNYYNHNPIYTIQVACSADGRTFIASQQNGYPGGIYISSDTGSTWQSFTNGGSLNYLVAASADGCQLVASGTNGSIYLIQSIPSPKLNLTPSLTNLALSWIIPSTNFVLQQSSDLISWADVTNAPALNLTNLQNQVTLTPSNSSGFYRLKTP